MDRNRKFNLEQTMTLVNELTCQIKVTFVF